MEKEEKKVAENQEVKASAMVRVDFEKELVVTGYEVDEIKTDNPAVPVAYWHKLSFSDGKGFYLERVTADKSCMPNLVKVFTRYKVGFQVIQTINKGKPPVIALRVVQLIQV